MKNPISRLLFLFLPLALVLTFFSCGQNGRPTTQNAPHPTVVYLVRHAEKVTDNPSDEDPDLTPDGYARAEDLKEHLADVEIQALFSTPYRRTRSTLGPLAQEHGIEIQPYEAHDFAALAEKINREYAEQTVVVAGHSNTLLELAEALGAKRPKEKLADHEYDYLFRVVKEGDRLASVEMRHYGQPSAEPVAEK
ncbi:phosphoglycerate mutase family protein [soil metagenome]